MSIFRKKTAGGKNRPRVNRRVSGQEPVRKSAGNVKSGGGRKNRRLAEEPKNRKPGNRRVAPDTDSKTAEENGRTKKRAVRTSAANEEEKTENNSLPPEAQAPSKMGPLLWAGLRVVAVVITVAVVVWGAKVVYQYALTSAYFGVQHVEINGNERLSNSDVLTAAGIEMDQNIFEVKLPEVIRRLEDTPWVVEANATQKLPKTIIIDIVERRPEILVLFDVPYLVDESGEIFKRWVPGDPLPECMITGLTHRDLVEDMEGSQQVILDAIALRERYIAVGNHRYATLFEIHHEIDGGFSLTVGKKPVLIHCILLETSMNISMEGLSSIYLMVSTR